MTDDKGLGWIPDKKLPSRHMKDMSKFNIKYLMKLRSMDPNKKLFLKDFKELYDEIEKEIEEEKKAL